MKSSEKFKRFLARHRRRFTIWVTAVTFICLFLVAAEILDIPLPESSAVPFGFIILIAFFCEFMDSSLGMGYGTTLAPLLLLMGYTPAQVVPAILMSELAAGFGSTFFHHRDGNVNFIKDRRPRKIAMALAGLSLVGALSAVLLAMSIPSFWLLLTVGIIIVSVGVLVTVTSSRKMKFSRNGLFVLGAVAAFNKGLSGGGYGPLLSSGQVAFGVPVKQAVAITTFAEVFTCITGLAAYALMMPLDLKLCIPLSVGALLSVPWATLTVKHVPESLMKKLIGTLTIAFGSFLLIKVLL